FFDGLFWNSTFSALSLSLSLSLSLPLSFFFPSAALTPSLPPFFSTLQDTAANEHGTLTGNHISRPTTSSPSFVLFARLPFFPSLSLSLSLSLSFFSLQLSLPLSLSSLRYLNKRAQMCTGSTQANTTRAPRHHLLLLF